jgi:gluconate 2-dehydrogenase gamma chain
MMKIESDPNCGFDSRQTACYIGPMQRREFVERIAAVLAGTLGTVGLAEAATTGAFAATLSETAPLESLTADQARLLDTITAHIVPTDDTPGAREARVVRFIDHALTTIFKDFKKEFFATLDEFAEFSAHYRPDGKPFLELSHTEQVAALRDLERVKPEVFGPLRGLTMVGMFSHPHHCGNYRKIGWELIGYRDQYSWAPPFGYYDRV